MDIRVTSQPLAQTEADAVAINLFQGEKADEGELKTLDESVGRLISRAIADGEIVGKPNETLLLHLDERIKAPRLLVVGSGQRAEFTQEKVATFAGLVVRSLRKRGAKRIAIQVRGDLNPAKVAQAASEGAILGLYDPDAYKTRDKEEHPVNEFIINLPEENSEINEAVGRGKIIAEAANFTRFLANEPANKMTPTIIAEHARRVAEEYGLEIEILGPADMEQLGMGALLGVARGSEEPARLVFLRYKGAEEGPMLGLVGKTITFDSGGISLKPGEGMHEMKMDMSGGAAVLGAMQAIAQLKPAINVIGVMPATENLPSGKALKPGDVLTAMNGKTIEVLNTDAEGRLVLSDGLIYAQRKGATHLVDVATLTGACVVALGNITTGLMGSPQEWVDEFKAVAEDAGEKMWQLPLFPEYKEQIKSPIADMKNIGGRGAGAITAAMLLKEFVEDGVPWVHLDIAGTAWTEKGTASLAEGPTGVPVRSLVNLALRMAAKR